MIKKGVALLLSLVFCAWGQKIEITSIEMKATELNKKIRFIGNAKVVQGSDWIIADEIIVYFDENNQTKQYEAIGHVRFEIKERASHYRGQAHKVIFYPKKLIYELKGKAVIDDLFDKRHIVAEKIVLDTKTGNAEVIGNHKKPIKFIFNTEKKGE